MTENSPQPHWLTQLGVMGVVNREMFLTLNGSTPTDGAAATLLNKSVRVVVVGDAKLHFEVGIPCRFTTLGSRPTFPRLAVYVVTVPDDVVADPVGLASLAVGVEPILG